MGMYIVHTLVTGSYSDSRGIEIIRRHVAEFISHRDGVPCDFKNVYLVNGASDGIKTMLYVVMGDECSPAKTGVMIPTPQYPLYTAALAELGAIPVSCVKSKSHIFVLLFFLRDCHLLVTHSKYSENFHCQFHAQVT